MGIEIRNLFAKMVSADIAVFDILGNTSISSMGMLAAAKSKLVPQSLRGGA